jgi:hypothetical protein
MQVKECAFLVSALDGGERSVHSQFLGREALAYSVKTRIRGVQNKVKGKVVRFNVFTAVTMKNVVFWDDTP